MSHPAHDFQNHFDTRGKVATALLAGILLNTGQRVPDEELPLLNIGRRAGDRRRVHAWGRALVLVDLREGNQERAKTLIQYVRGAYTDITVLPVGSQDFDPAALTTDEDVQLADDPISGRPFYLMEECSQNMTSFLLQVGDVWEPGICDMYLDWELAAPTRYAPKATPYYRRTIEQSLTWELDVPISVRTPFLYLDDNEAAQVLDVG